jgi:hypothetical protein
MRDGSAAPLLFYSAQASLTRSRTEGLSERLSGDIEAEVVADEVPEGASTAEKASEAFFNAYKTHDRVAAGKVATEAVLAELVWDPAAGEAEGLQLMDPTHIYYVGGSLALEMKTNGEGKWFVSRIEARAD